MMARWTNERWASTLHRVVNPPLGMAQSRRLSIGMFVHPNYDQRIECVPTCLNPGERTRLVEALLDRPRGFLIRFE